MAFFSRRVFLERLGTEFLGLSTTLQNLLGFLNLAELGVGAAISYVLYKPIAEDDKQKIHEIISILGYCSRWTGIAIGISGVILSFFLPIIYAKSTCSLGVVFYGYYAYLIPSLTSYFINYRMTLLSADQKNYVVTKYYKTSNLIQLGLQMLFAYYVADPYIYISILLATNIVYSIILNWKITQTYPWLKPERSRGREYLRKYPEIIHYVRQIFIQKITGLLSSQITPLFLYAFISLESVTVYGNYETVISKFSLVTYALFSSIFASVGNLIASTSEEKSESVFREILALSNFVSGLCIFGTYALMDHFICLWIGEQYLLSEGMLILFLINFYFSQQSGILEMYTHGFGLFSDIYVPAVESTIYILSAIIGGKLFGQFGILLAVIVSRFTTWQLWKPFYLYKNGFNKNVIRYWIFWIKHIILQLVGYLICVTLLKKIMPYRIQSWYAFTLYAILAAVLYCIIVGPMMYVGGEGTKEVFRRLYHRFSPKYGG